MKISNALAHSFRRQDAAVSNALAEVLRYPYLKSFMTCQRQRKTSMLKIGMDAGF